MLLRILLLIVGVYACSTAVIFIKISEEHAVLLSSYRLLVAAVLLTPVFIRDFRRQAGSFAVREFRATIVPGIMLGLHFISWISCARMTNAANASLIVNLVPVAMPFFMLMMIRERLNRNEVAGTIAALVGLFLLSGTDYELNREYFWGDVGCFVSMLFFAFYLALGRRNRHFPTTWLYVVPLYYVAGFFCLLVALPFVNPIKPYPLRELGLIAALGIIPTIVGHSILNASMQQLRGQIVSVVNMGQFVFAGIMAFFFLAELPHTAFYIASVLVVAGSYLAIRGQTPDRA